MDTLIYDECSYYGKGFLSHVLRAQGQAANDVEILLTSEPLNEFEQKLNTIILAVFARRSE